jgi:hypothetical protein
MFIVKLPLGAFRDIVENEYLTTAACRALLPDDDIVKPVVGKLQGIAERALIVPGFDRLRSGAKRYFEEFNQLLGKRSGDDKYDAAYDDLGKFIRATPGCTPVDAWRLYRRILACLRTETGCGPRPRSRNIGPKLKHLHAENTSWASVSRMARS